jgi:2-polyprenyl-3-methyl-5-hydroxy-6-metoxy-1,4-benzoquinol methylase
MKENIISGIDAAGSHTLQVIAKADKFNKWIYHSFSKHLHGEILEIGSGIGNISKYVIADKHRITLSDYNPEYFNWLKKYFTSYENVKEVLQIDLLHSDFMNKYGSSKEKYDCIILLNVIEHLQDDSMAIQNCLFLMKPGARLIVLAPAYQWLYCNLDKQLGHFRRYTLHSMIRLFLNYNIEISEKKYSNFLGICGWIVFGKILGKKLLGGEVSVFNKSVPLAKMIDRIIINRAGLSVIVIGVKK